MEPGTASIGYAISILVLTPIAIALIYLVGLGAKALQGKAAESWSIGMMPYLAAWIVLFPAMLVASLILGVGAVMVERAQRKDVATQQALQDQRDFMQIQVNATARTGLYDEEMSDYEKRRGY